MKHAFPSCWGAYTYSLHLSAHLPLWLSDAPGEEVTIQETVYDHGCGEGRAIIAAAKKYDAKGWSLPLVGSDVVEWFFQNTSKLH